MSQDVSDANEEQANAEAEQATKDAKIDLVTRALAVISLLVSLGSLGVAGTALYYNSLEHRYQAHMAYGQTRLKLTVGDGANINVDDQTLTFANGGNQPIAIQRLAYLVKGVRHDPDDKSCPDDEKQAEERHAKQMNQAGTGRAPVFSEITSRLYGLALAKGFAPFAVKAGEIDVRHYDFAGKIPIDQLMPARPTQESWNVVACIFVEMFSVGTGSVEIEVPVAYARVEGKNELPQLKLFGRSEGRPFELIGTRRLGN